MSDEKFILDCQYEALEKVAHLTAEGNHNFTISDLVSVIYDKFNTSEQRYLIMSHFVAQAVTEKEAKKRGVKTDEVYKNIFENKNMIGEILANIYSGIQTQIAMSRSSIPSEFTKSIYVCNSYYNDFKFEIIKNANANSSKRISERQYENTEREHNFSETDKQIAKNVKEFISYVNMQIDLAKKQHRSVNVNDLLKTFVKTKISIK